MQIKDWLKQSKIDNLDAQLLLSHVLRKPKEWLLAHDDAALSESVIIELNNLEERRQNHEPMAYILGKKEFYRRNFIVTPDVLIPRPETEQLIDYCLTQPAKKILDVGTGSGCIAITLKLENPGLIITASDISDSALKVAKKNWQNHKNEKGSLGFVQSNLLDDIDEEFDIIVANLPYVDKSWNVSHETKFEPQSALFAQDNGTSLIRKLIQTAPKNLTPNGVLALELDPRSVTDVKKHCKNYNVVFEKPFILVLQLATIR